MGTRRNKINGNEFPKRFIAKSRWRSNEGRILGKERGREKGATEARASSLKLATRADSDAAKGDRVFMSKRAWHRRYEGWEEVVFTRGGCTSEAVNNDGFFFFSPFPFSLFSLSLGSVSFFSLPSTYAPPEIVFHCVGGSLKKAQREEFLSLTIMTPFARSLRARYYYVSIVTSRHVFLSKKRLEARERTVDIYLRDERHL